MQGHAPALTASDGMRGSGGTHIQTMMSESDFDPNLAWAAFERRDRAFDGCFVGAVRTTGIYCRPSCPARHPKREHVVFYADGAAALEAGFRACLRCVPDEVSREEEALRKAHALIAEVVEPVRLAGVAAAVGYSPHHFHRLFKRATGVTLAAYAREKRSRSMEQALKSDSSITDAIYEAGYSGPGRFYADAKARLGMTPSAWREGGRGETIRWAVAETYLGPMLVAATERGICRVSFDESEEALRSRFANADIIAGGEGLQALVEEVVAAVATPERPHDLPLNVQGTAFQQAVWRELGRVPAGESLSYSELAARAGKPGAARAAGTACGANQVAVLIPCHRARRGDGSAGGYAYGLERKAELLRREKATLI